MSDQTRVNAKGYAIVDRAGRRQAEPWEKDRRAALEAVRKALGRRADTAGFDPVQAMARGLVTDGKHLRALAPTLQIGLMAVAHRRRKEPLLTPRQLAGLCAYHQAWLGMGAGVGAVDPARVRVDGGGAGDGDYARAMACDAARTWEALRGAVAKADPLYLGLLDHVVIRDQGIESYEDARTGLYRSAEVKAGIRAVMLASAADALARQIGA